MSEIDNRNNSYKAQEKAAFLSFLFGLPGFIGLVITILLTGSLVTLIDFLDSLCNLIRDGFIWLLAHKLKYDLKYEFNYGVSRLETLSALLCDGIMVAGLCIVFFSSLRELFNPSAPSSLLIVALICKIGAVITDTYMLFKQYRISKESSSTVGKVALAGAIKNVSFDGTILVAYIICWLFRNNPVSFYFSPVICILIAIVLGRQSFLRIVDNIKELIDKTLDEDAQMKIIKVMNRYYDSYEDLIAINSHKIGGKLMIDLEISFAEDETFARINELRNKLEADLDEEIGDCDLNIVIAKKQ